MQEIGRYWVGGGAGVFRRFWNAGAQGKCGNLCAWQRALKVRERRRKVFVKELKTIFHDLKG